MYCVGWDLQIYYLWVSEVQEVKSPAHLQNTLELLFYRQVTLYTLQGEAAGAQAFSNIDTLLLLSLLMMV